MFSKKKLEKKKEYSNETVVTIYVRDWRVYIKYIFHGREHNEKQIIFFWTKQHKRTFYSHAPHKIDLLVQVTSVLYVDSQPWEKWAKSKRYLKKMMCQRFCQKEKIVSGKVGY